MVVNDPYAALQNAIRKLSPSMSALALPLASSAISYFQAIVLGVLQGVTELFPISSLGHTVLFPTLFGWNGS